MTFRKHKLIKLNPEGLRRWSNAKSRLQWTVPAFTHLIYKMMNPDDTDQIAWFTSEIKTLATDGRRMIINPDYFFGLTDKQQTFASCHEVCHAMYMHPTIFANHQRNQTTVQWEGKALPFHPKIANYAADFCINAMLVESKIGEIHPSWLFDHKIAVGSTPWQEAYHRLWEECEASSPAQGGQPEASEGESEPGDGDQGQLPQPMGSDDTFGTTPRFEAGQFDDHLPAGATDQREASDPKAQADPQRWQQAVMGAQAVGRAAGNLPEALDKAFDAMLKPAIMWTDHIQGQLARSVNGAGYDYRRLDRRLITRGIGAPGRSGKGCGTLVVGMDSSGSIYGVPQLIERFFAETAGMFEDLNPRKIVIIWCDAAVARVDEIEDASDMRDAYYKGAPGGGGTRFAPVFEKVQELGIEDCDALVYLTDGENFDHDELKAAQPEYPVIWGMIGEPREWPFGSVVNIPTDGSA